MSFGYYFGTYKKPVFELLEEEKPCQALVFLQSHRCRDGLCDRQRVELWVLEAYCYQDLRKLSASESALKLAKQEIDFYGLKGATLCFYLCAKAEEDILRNYLQAAVVNLKQAEFSAETNIQRGIVMLDYSFINYRQGLFDDAYKYALMAKKLLKDDSCRLLHDNCQAIMVKTTRWPKWTKFWLKIRRAYKEKQPRKFKTLVTIGAE